MCMVLSGSRTDRGLWFGCWMCLCGTYPEGLPPADGGKRDRQMNRSWRDYVDDLATKVHNPSPQDAAAEMADRLRTAKRWLADQQHASVNPD